MDPPSRLEVNLSYIPLDVYDSGLPGSNYIPSCTGMTVRQCYQNALNTYYSQRRVTGVRFFFALCGGFYSTALNGCGGTVQFNSAWRTSLNKFLKDIYDSGIRNITPTPAFSGVGGDIGVVGYSSGVPLTYSCNGGSPKTVGVQWWPALTYALRASNGHPLNENQQQEYNCSPQNDVNFVGWQNIYTVISNVLQAANSNPLCSQAPHCHLNVEELDLTNEVNLSAFTVQARLIVDNKRGNENVFGNIRNLMSQNGQLSSRVTYSVTGDNTSEAGCDCGSVYGDSARLLHVSALAGGLGGGRIGLPELGSDTSGYGARCAKLYCAINPSNPDISDMIGLPLSYPEPTIVDMHNAPCVLNATTDGCKDERDQNVQATEARLTFSGIKSFLDSFCPSGWRHNSPELCAALFMLGETGLFRPWPDSGSWWNCEGVPRVVPAATVQGLNNSTLSGRTLTGGAAGVVFRPWINVPAGGCYNEFPATLQPTFVPSP